MSSAHTAVPFIPVEDPGTTAEEFVPTLATPEIKLFTKHWVPSSVTAGKPPVAALLFVVRRSSHSCSACLCPPWL